MDPALHAKIEARLAELPPDVRQAIQSAAWEPKLREIGQRYALHIDQMGMLENETLLVMLGFASADEFTAQIAQELDIPQERAQLLAADINSQVFLSIRESMKRFMEERSKNAPAPTMLIPEQPIPPPAPASPTPQLPVVAPTPLPAPVTPEPKLVDLHAETILSTPTSSTASPKPEAPPGSPVVKVDPYREPTE